MKEEFNLSEKIGNWSYPSDGLLNVDDVKEFIRRLKEEVNNPYINKKRKNIDSELSIKIWRVKDIINKLAGKSLI